MLSGPSNVQGRPGHENISGDLESLSATPDCGRETHVEPETPRHSIGRGERIREGPTRLRTVNVGSSAMVSAGPGSLTLDSAVG